MTSRWQSLKPRERDILQAVLHLCRIHPAVYWVARINSGAFKVEGRYVRFGFPGCSDILGQLRDGRMLAIETKTPKGRLTADQDEFLRKVGHKGVSVVARSVEDVRIVLDALLRRSNG